MKRDAIDLTEVRPIHAGIHDRLLNWASWCSGAGQRCAVLPMFRYYRHGYEEPTAGSGVDTLDGHRVEKEVVRLPDKHRSVLQWAYVRPYIPVVKVRRALGLSYAGLGETLHDARSMLKNRLREDWQHGI